MSTFDTVREMIVDPFQLDPALVTLEATADNVALRAVQDPADEIGRLAGAKPGNPQAKKGTA